MNARVRWLPFAGVLLVLVLGCEIGVGTPTPESVAIQPSATATPEPTFTPATVVASTRTPEPTNTQAPVPQQTATPQPAGPTLTPTATPTPTSSPTPSATPTASPTPTPTAVPIPRPVASFSIDMAGGPAPANVQFTDTSRGAVTSWEWDFGDGDTSAEQNPSHRYTIAGKHSVKLTVAGPGGTDSSELVELVTVFTGPLDILSVSPASATVFLGETVQFAAFAVDAFGNEIGGSTLWNVQDEAGSVSPSGLFAAGTSAGTFTVVARFLQESRGLTVASATVTIKPGPLSTVELEPTAATLDAEEIRPFTLTILDEFGNEIRDATTSWSVLSGVGSIDQNGVLSAGTKAGDYPGAVKVEVVRGGARASATADVSIVPGPLAKIQVEPSVAFVEKGLTRRFEATAYDQHGNELGGLAFLWAGTGGDVTQGGVYTAGNSPGAYDVRVTATLGSSTASGLATVGIPPVWMPTEDMLAARVDHSATLLSNGKVLIVGGGPDTAELYDPDVGAFSLTRDPVCNHGRSANATTLADGRVLITGRSSDARCAEVYDPETGRFSRVGDLNADHWQHTGTLLEDGTVLVTGGFEYQGDAWMTHTVSEIYDPVTQAFVETGSLNVDRRLHAAVLLASGQVLVTGGIKSTAIGAPGPSVCLTSPEMYDPSRGTFRPIGEASFTSCHVQAALLENGTVLLTSNARRREVFDPESETFRETAEVMASTIEGYSATRLADGRVLTAGGITPVTSPLAPAPVFKEVVFWDFTQGLHEWAGNFVADNLRSTVDGLEFESLGHDPFVWSPWFDSPVDENLRITFRMRSSANNRGDFHYHKQGIWSGYFEFNPNPDGEWHTYVFEIAPQGEDTQIRIDPATAAGNITIAWLRIESFVAPEFPDLYSEYELLSFWDFRVWPQAWVGINVTNLTTTSDGVEFETIVDNHSIQSAYFVYPAGQSLRITMWMKSTGNDLGEFYWGQPGIVTHRQEFSPIPDGDWHEYVFEVPPQDGRTFIQVAPATAPGHFAVAWISVESLARPKPAPSAFATVEVYDPATDAFTTLDGMNSARQGHAATLLSDGRVLITGGTTSGEGSTLGTALSSTEVWIPSSLVADSESTTKGS